MVVIDISILTTPCPQSVITYSSMLATAYIPYLASADPSTYRVFIGSKKLLVTAVLPSDGTSSGLKRRKE